MANFEQYLIIMKKHSGKGPGRPGRDDKKGGTGKKYPGKKPFGKTGSYGRRKEDDRPESEGDKRERSGNYGKPFAKKSYGEKKPYGKKTGEERKSFGDRPKPRYGEEKPFAKKWEERKPGERPKPRYGEEKPFAKKWEERKPGDRPKPRYGEEKPFVKKWEERKPGDRTKPKYGEEKPFGKKKWEERKPYGDRGEKRGDERKAPGDKKEYGESYTGFRKHEEMRRMKEELGDDWKTFDNKNEARDFTESKSRKRVPSRGRNARPEPVAFPDDQQIRLNRFIANTGVCSRREADDLIEAGVIKVNGEIVTALGTKIGPGDTVHYGDQLLKRESLQYVLLNKPKDYITTTDDPQERKTVLHLVQDAGKERIYPVGRLDRNTTGLLLLTNDGDLAERLMHPRYGVRKIYQVSLDKNLRPDDYEKILEGVELEDGVIKADELSYVGDGVDKKEVGIVLHSGRNRLVRRLFEQLGYQVLGLDRVSYAGLTKKNLPRGRWRYLEQAEVGLLKMQVGGTKKSGGRFKKRS